MHYFFGFGIFLSLLLLMIGLKKPRLVIHWGKRNRIQVIKFYALLLIVFIILFNVFPSPKQTDNPIQTADKEQVTNNDGTSIPTQNQAVKANNQQPTHTENKEKPAQPSDQQQGNSSQPSFDKIAANYGTISHSYNSIIYDVQHNNMSKNEAIGKLRALRSQGQLYSKYAMFCDYDDEQSRSHLSEALSYLTNSIFEFEDYLLGSQLQLDGAKEDLDAATKEFNQIKYNR